MMINPEIEHRHAQQIPDAFTCCRMYQKPNKGPRGWVRPCLGLHDITYLTLSKLAFVIRQTTFTLASWHDVTFVLCLPKHASWVGHLWPPALSKDPLGHCLSAVGRSESFCL